MEQALTRFLDTQQDLMEEIGALPLMEVARQFLAGGKRLRPAFAYWSHVAAAGEPGDPGAVVAAAASLDLLHVSALVHDDLIDASDTRRGVPAAHRQYEARHRDANGTGDTDHFGRAAAILLGDLLLMWSVEMFHTSGVGEEAIRRARPHLDAMRTEVTAGQYLDVAAAFGMAPHTTLAEELTVAERILEFKSARYSVRRPAQIGAAMGSPDPALQESLGRFGSLVGRAFQLRDDVLGVYGDPALTGKPVGGDVREGKRTVLVLEALRAADGSAASELATIVGSHSPSDADVSRACDIIEATGARSLVEQRIERDLEEALRLLQDQPMDATGRQALQRLALLSVRREA